MKNAVPVLCVALLLAPLLAAGEEGVPAKTLQLSAKAVLVPAPQAIQHAPFLVQPGEPNLDFQVHNTDERLNEIRASCETSGRSLCYDTDSGKIVYKKTAAYMPDIPGMRAEHISVRRDRVTFKYTFP